MTSIERYPLLIRLAEWSELAWINERYEEVEFVPSHFEKERIAVAEWEGQKAGLGRLVTVDAQHLELGGMYVLPAFQGKGIAGEIVRFLLQFPQPTQRVFCIPFVPLVPFYKRYGFVECPDLENVPEELLKKFRWCQNRYPTPTAFLVLG